MQQRLKVVLLLWVVGIACIQPSASQSDGEEEECICVVYHRCGTKPYVKQGSAGGGGAGEGGGTDMSGDQSDQNTGGVGLIDIRVSGRCEHYLHACCPPANIIPEEGETGTGGTGEGNGGTGGGNGGTGGGNGGTGGGNGGTGGGNGGTGGGNGGTGTGEDTFDNIFTSPRPPTDYGCGHRNLQGVGFSITGNVKGEAQFGEFPWMVAIHAISKKGNTFNYQCGGSLIHHKAVLTAAHCVNNLPPHNLKIRAGEWDTQTVDEQYPYQERGVAGVVIHEQYYEGALYNDIAILILDEPVDHADNIGTICLPEQGDIFDAARCFASGWGKEFYGKEGSPQEILKRRELPVVPRKPCEASLRKTRLGKFFKLHESFICAGGEAGVDTCTGDGGSPLVCPLRNEPQNYQQVGIVAWGIGCGESQLPGVYANVAHFRHWIDQKMADNLVDSTEYVRVAKN